MKNNIILVILSLIVAGTACDRYSDAYSYDPDYYKTHSDLLVFRNFSSDSTVWFIPEAECAENLPDSLTEWQKISIYVIAPHSSFSLSYDSEDSYVTPEETYGPKDRFTVYVFKYRDWSTYLWKDLVNGKKWVGKASLTVEEAAALKNIITYPIR